MTSPETTPSPRSRFGLKFLVAIGSTVAVVGGVFGWLGWRELQNRLPNIISEELSGALGRPIKLGELQRLGFTGLRFGETILPPTAEDFTWARVQATDISLNPWDLLVRRTFRPSLLLLRPEVAVKQRFDRTWVLEPPDSVDNEGTVKTEIGRIRIRNGSVAIGPVSRQQIVQAPPGFSSAQLIVLENVNLSVNFRGEQNERVSLNLGGRLGNGTFRIRGEGNLETGETNLTLLGKRLPIENVNPFLGGSLFLGDGYGYANLYTEFRPDQSPPLSIEGAARLQNGEAAITGLPSVIQNIYGRLQFREQRVTFDDADFRFGPILAQVRGSVSLQDGFQVGVELPDVSLEQVATAFAQPLPIDAAGRFALLTEVRGPLRSPRFQSRLTNLAPIVVDRIDIDQVSANLSGDTDALRLETLQILPADGGSITAQGQIDFDANLLQRQSLPPTALDLTAAVDLPIASLVNRYGLELPVAVGRLTADTVVTGPLFDPVGAADWQISDGIVVGGGRVEYADSIARLAETQLTIAESGSATATGQVDLSTGLLNIAADAVVPLDELAQSAAIALPTGLVLGTLTTQADIAGEILTPVAAGRWQLRQGTVPGRGRLTIANQGVRIRDTTFDIGDGQLSAVGQANLSTGFWDLDIAGSRLNLGVVSPQLVGLADVELQASGNLADLSPAGLRAQGAATVADGVPLAIANANSLLEGPLALSFDWDGRILGIPTLTAPGLDVSGQVATTPDTVTGFPALDTFDFAVRLQDYDLAQINAVSPLASGLEVRGLLDFDGNLSGSWADPAVQGTVALRETGVGSLALQSAVSGAIAASRSRGATLDLVGDLTTLRADIGADWRPVSLLFSNGPIFAQAQREGDWLRGQIRDLPLDALGIRPITTPNLGVIHGTLRSDFAIQMSTLFSNPTARASFTVERPALGTYAATALQGQLRLAEGRAVLDEAVLDFPNSRFDLAATATVRSPLAIEASLTTTDAEIQDILTALHLDEIADIRNLFAPLALGDATDLATTPIITDPENFPGQLQQAAAARDLEAQRTAAAARMLIPPLSDLKGKFAADLTLTASEHRGVEATFDVSGQNWLWGEYDFDNRFIAKGSLQDEVLAFAPIRLETGEASLNLEGQLARDGFNTQLAIAHFDLAPLGTWLSLPLPIQGEVNAIATLTGNPSNPTLLGSVTIDEAAVNDYPLDIGGDFSYRDAWLRFAAGVKGVPDEPLIVQGQVPYALPFMTLQPDSNQLLVQASLSSGGFALLDMFSPYVAWGGGDASLLVEAKGPLARPEVVGLIEFQNASLVSDFLGESLTDLQGNVGFAGDRLYADELQGSLLTGAFRLAGELPFSNGDAEQAPATEPLTLTLNQLLFNFQNEIASALDGQLTINNSLETPLVGGEVMVSGIDIRVGQETLDLANSLLFESDIEQLTAALRNRFAALNLDRPSTGRFDNLRIVIPDVAEVLVNPLASADFTGQITLAGPFTRPTGDGYIEVLDGWVNTITTNLFLATGGQRNLIILSPEDGFDPYVDLRFRGRLPLQRQLDLEPTNEFALGNTSEIPDFDPLASLTLFDEIDIEALVEGHISEGASILELTSIPEYSENRLLSMLSGGYLSDLPEGEPLLTTATNLVFAFFTEPQESIGEALGLRQFRVGATTTLPGDQEDLFSFGLGVNVGITDSFSASLVQVLNRNQPYQLNLRYRLNNEFELGSSTNFSEESRIFMQYRIGF